MEYTWGFPELLSLRGADVLSRRNIARSHLFARVTGSMVQLYLRHSLPGRLATTSTNNLSLERKLPRLMFPVADRQVAVSHARCTQGTRAKGSVEVGFVIRGVAARSKAATRVLARRTGASSFQRALRLGSGGGSWSLRM